MKHTTERGFEIEIQPIPLILERVRANLAKRAPAVPQYSEDISGTEVWHDITPELAEESARESGEWWAKYAGSWAEHQRLKEEFDEEVEAEILKVILLKAVTGISLPEDEGWMEILEHIGIDVPEKPFDRLALYIETEVLGGPADVLAVMLTAQGVELDEETLGAAESSFRYHIQGMVSEALDRETPE